MNLYSAGFIDNSSGEIEFDCHPKMKEKFY